MLYRVGMRVPRFTTPYYLAGRSADRWHREQGNKSFKTGVGLAAAGGAAMKWPDQAHHVVQHHTGANVSRHQVKTGGAFATGVGAAYLAHGAYHYGRAAAYEKKLRGKGRGVGARAVSVKDTVQKAKKHNRI